jgi:uncharacterized membrane protein YvbJ
MPYCHKCGSEVKENDTFCPRCGTNLKATTAQPSPPPAPIRNEKQEKNEKNEKDEKYEKMEKSEQPEKQQFGVIGPLVGGIIMIFAGIMFYLAVTGAVNFSSVFPFVLIIIGAIVILGVVVGAFTARQRNPTPET